MERVSHLQNQFYICGSRFTFVDRHTYSQYFWPRFDSLNRWQKSHASNRCQKSHYLSSAFYGPICEALWHQFYAIPLKMYCKYLVKKKLIVCGQLIQFVDLDLRNTFYICWIFFTFVEHVLHVWIVLYAFSILLAPFWAHNGAAKIAYVLRAENNRNVVRIHTSNKLTLTQNYTSNPKNTDIFRNTTLPAVLKSCSFCFLWRICHQICIGLYGARVGLCLAFVGLWTNV